MKVLTSQIKSFPIFFGPDKETTGGKSEVHISDDAKDFMKNFAPPPGMVPTKEPPVPKQDDEPKGKEPVVDGKVVEKKTKEASERLAERKAQEEKDARERKEDRTPGKKPGFVESQIEAKRKAEAEKEAALEELRTFKEVEVPRLNTQIADLQKKIDSGELSSTREKEYTTKIEALEKEKAEGSKTLTEELQATRSKLALYDLREDPEFVETYVRPMAISINKMSSLVDQDVQRSQMLEQALLANQQSLTATTANARKVAEQQRDTLVDTILEGWPETTKRRFSTIFEEFINTSERQAIALANHQETTTELRRRGVVNQQEEAKKVLRIWHAEFDALENDYKDDLSLTKEQQDRLKELKYVYEPDEVQREIEKVLAGKADIPEAVKVIRYGQAYHAVKAKNAALVAENEALKATITKLKGGSQAGGNQNNHVQPPTTKTGRTAEGEITNEQGQTRGEWTKKFSAARRG